MKAGRISTQSASMTKCHFCGHSERMDQCLCAFCRCSRNWFDEMMGAGLPRRKPGNVALEDITIEEE
jgi:hypothetical protein